MTGSVLVTYALLILGSYLLGSFPSGYIVGRLNGIDVRQFGSGKTGGTNVLRTLGWGAMIVVAGIDIIKGMLAVLVARYVTDVPLVVVLCALAVIAGHNWPVYIRFKGGSGVATGFGALLGFAPALAPILLVVFAVPVALTRYMSLGSILAAACAPVLLFAAVVMAGLPLEYALFGFVGAALILWRHRANMERLLAGNERKIGERVEVTRETTPPANGPTQGQG